MVKVPDRYFRPYISSEEIQQAVEHIALEIGRAFEGECPLFLVILNGSFMFAADLMRYLPIDCEICFVKVKSYSGMSSMGVVEELIGIDVPLRNRPVIVVEDIVDTGHTLNAILNQIAHQQPSQIRVACLLHKAEATQYPLHLDYVGFEIPNKFVLGYGLDYDGLGRNYNEIYQLDED
ncbi:MAG: hypoxanthine phosphoribosyltransferase [Sphingobacteriales bacterium]|nr:hypoxanthine phosphoribosyltransferase [Sphingobacteriales bacterium]